MSVNSNLARHLASVVASLTIAEERGTHAHASLTVGACGEGLSGPVLEWDYVAEDEEKFGFLELLDYKGDVVRGGINRVGLYDIRACWDSGCLRRSKAPRPGSRAPLGEQAETGYDPYAGTGHDGE